MEENVEKLLELRSKTKEEKENKKNELDSNLQNLEEDFKTYQTDNILEKEAQREKFESLKKEYEDKAKAEIEQLDAEIDGQNRRIGRELKDMSGALIQEEYKTKKANEAQAELVAQAKAELEKAQEAYNRSLMSMFHQGDMQREDDNASFDQSQVTAAEEKYNKLLAELNEGKKREAELGKKIELVGQFLGKVSVKDAKAEDILAAISGVEIKKEKAEEEPEKATEEPAQEEQTETEQIESEEQVAPESEPKADQDLENPVAEEPNPLDQDAEDIAPEMPITEPDKAHTIEVTGEFDIPSDEARGEVYPNPYAEEEQEQPRTKIGSLKEALEFIDTAFVKNLELKEVKFDVRTGKIDVVFKNVRYDENGENPYEIDESISVDLTDIEERKVKDKQLRKQLKEKYGIELEEHEDPYLVHGINNAIDKYMKNNGIENEKAVNEVRARLEEQYKEALEDGEGLTECSIKYEKSEEGYISKFGFKTLEKLVTSYMRKVRDNYLPNVTVADNIDTRTRFEKVKDFFTKILPSKVKALGSGKHTETRDSQDEPQPVGGEVFGENEPEKLNSIQKQRQEVQKQMAEQQAEKAKVQAEAIENSLMQNKVISKQELEGNAPRQVKTDKAVASQDERDI